MGKGKEFFSLFLLMALLVSLFMNVSADNDYKVNMYFKGQNNNEIIIKDNEKVNYVIDFNLDTIKAGDIFEINMNNIPISIDLLKSEMAKVGIIDMDSVSLTGSDGSSVLSLKIADDYNRQNHGGNNVQVESYIQFEKVDSPEEKLISWTIDGVSKQLSIFVLPANSIQMNNNRNKSVKNGGNIYTSFSQDITINEQGDVVVADNFFNNQLEYQIAVDTTEAKKDFVINDVLPSWIKLVGNDITYQQETFNDYQGYQYPVGKNTGTVSATLNDTGFSATLDLPAYSKTVFTYKVQPDISKKTSVITALQTEYNAKKASANNTTATFQVSLNIVNKVVFSDTNEEKNNTVYLNKNFENPNYTGPQPELEVGKKPTVNKGFKAIFADEVNADGTLKNPFTIDYQFTVKLKNVDEITAMQDNIIVKDVLAEFGTWDQTKGITVNGQALTYQAVTTTEIIKDEYINSYTIVNNELVINIGKTVKEYVVSATAQINKSGVFDQYGWPAPKYNFNNQVLVSVGTLSKTADGNVGLEKITVDPQHPEKRDDVFKKEQMGSNIIYGKVGDQIDIPYKFTFSNPMAADLTKIVLADKIDRNVFVSSIDEIKSGMKVDIYPLNGWDNVNYKDYVDVVEENGELTFKLNDQFKVDFPEKVKEQIMISFKLKTQPLRQAQTITVKNNGEVRFEDYEVRYVNYAVSSYSSMIRSLEWQKSIWDTTTKEKVNNLRVEIDPATHKPKQSHFIYRVDMLLHDNYEINQLYVADILSDKVEFVAFVNENGQSLSADEYEYSNKVKMKRVVDANGVQSIIIERPDSVGVTRNVVPLYFEVKIKDDVNLVSGDTINNALANSKTTINIVNENEYALSLYKQDESNASVKITDRNARFKIVRESDQYVVTDQAYVSNGNIVVGDNAEAITVTEKGKYLITELQAPAGYQKTEQVYQAIVNDDGTSNAVVIYNQPDDTAPTAPEKPSNNTVTITATKVWVGGPEEKPSIQLQLYQNGQSYGEPVTLSAGVTQYQWTGLPKADSEGNDYQYTVDEITTLENYEKSVNGWIITNRYVEPLVVPKPTEPVNPPVIQPKPRPELPINSGAPSPLNPETPTDTNESTLPITGVDMMFGGLAIIFIASCGLLAVLLHRKIKE